MITLIGFRKAQKALRLAPVLTLFLLVTLFLGTCAPVLAAPVVGVGEAGPEPLLAAWYYDVLGNQTRMIQVATIFMIIGIAFLMWTRGK